MRPRLVAPCRSVSRCVTRLPLALLALSARGTLPCRRAAGDIIASFRIRSPHRCQLKDQLATWALCLVLSAHCLHS
ncbi:unnamed protein product, partial [Brenthis ino]